MAKFNVEVEIEGLKEFESLDQVIKAEIKSELKSIVIKDISKNIEREFKDRIKNSVNKINQQFESVTDEYLNSIFTDKIHNLKVPYKENSWSTEVEMMPINEYIGVIYEKSKDKDMIGSMIQKQVEKELRPKINKMLRNVQEESNKYIVDNIENLLREQLAADTIKRLNIPEMLSALQQKAIEFEG